MPRLRLIWNRFFGARRNPQRAPTRIIAGLGNPGPTYVESRHNVGFRILDLLGARHAAVWREDRSLQARVADVEIAGVACLLVQPQTFMNHSGNALRSVTRKWSAIDPRSALLIVYDDMDLPTGRIRLRPGGGAGGHRGIGDVIDELGTKEVPRLRFGVGHPGSARDVLDWVLAPFSKQEESLLLPEAFSRAADAIETVIREGVVAAMGQFNAIS